LQHPATHYNTPQHPATRHTNSATLYNTLQGILPHRKPTKIRTIRRRKYSATPHNTPQHPAIHHTILQHSTPAPTPATHSPAQETYQNPHHPPQKTICFQLDCKTGDGLGLSHKNLESINDRRG